MNDEDLDYCEMCGEVEKECVCDLALSIYEDSDLTLSGSMHTKLGLTRAHNLKLLCLMIKIIHLALDL